MKKEKYRFSRPEPWMCPGCEAFGRYWWIQDGYELINKEKGTQLWKYQLQSDSLEPDTVYKFKNICEVLAWWSGREDCLTYTEERAKECMKLYHDSVYDDNDYAILKRGQEEYCWRKNSNEVVHFRKPRIETKWFYKYSECLAEAKRILEEIEKEQSGEQMVLEEIHNERFD